MNKSCLKILHNNCRQSLPHKLNKTAMMVDEEPMTHLYSKMLISIY